jgi:hypothetical protein
MILCKEATQKALFLPCPLSLIRMKRPDFSCMRGWMVLYENACFGRSNSRE